MTRELFRSTLSALATVALLAPVSAQAETLTTSASGQPVPITRLAPTTTQDASNILSLVQPTSFNNESLLSAGTTSDCGCADAGSCGCSDRTRNWFGGVEATFLSPDLRGSSLNVATTTAAGPTTNTYTGENYDSFTAAPRIWVGVQGECYGLVARYWNMDGSSATLTPFGAAGPGVTSFERLENTTFDLEITRQFTRRCTDMTASFGVRYAEWDHTQSVSATEVVGADLVLGSAAASRRFEGVGLTGGVSGLRPIGCGNWNLFWNARASIVWGDTEQLVETQALALGPGGSAGSVNGAQAQSDDDLFVGELQIGLQRDFALQCIPATAFFRAAFEYQYWDANNGLATSTSAATASAAGGTAATSTAGGMRMDLYGLAVGAGFAW